MSLTPFPTRPLTHPLTHPFTHVDMNADLAEERLNLLREAYRTANRVNTTLQKCMTQLQQPQPCHTTTVIGRLEDSKLSKPEDSKVSRLTIEEFEQAISDVKGVGMDVTDAEIAVSDWREEMKLIEEIEHELTYAIRERSSSHLAEAITKAQEVTMIDGMLHFPTDTTSLHQLASTAVTTMMSVKLDHITTTLIQTMNDATIHDFTRLIIALENAQEYNSDGQLLLPYSLCLPHTIELLPDARTGHKAVDSSLLQVIFGPHNLLQQPRLSSYNYDSFTILQPN